MEFTTKQKGDLTELQCITACYEMGYNVSIPWGENTRYDFILDVDNQLYKIQCKTCHEIQDGRAVEFACATTHKNRSFCARSSYTKKEIDYFATFYKGECYFIPIEECGGKSKTLRVLPPKNGQTKDIYYLKDYLLSNTFLNTEC